MQATREPLFFGTVRDRYVAALLGALLLAVFGPTLYELAKVWVEREEYGHGLLMPPVALWMIWDRRHELVALKRRPSGADRWLIAGGLFALLPLMAALLLGEMKLSWFLKPYAFVASIAALIGLLYGWRGLKALAAPLVVLLLMCPLPWRILTWATLPLKRHAAVVATGLMDLSGLEASLRGNLIHVPGIDSLWIADACSGLRSVLSLFSVAVLGCLFWRRHWLLKLAVLGSCVPISILINGSRIWLTGMLSVHVSPAAAQGFFHTFEGFVLFGVAAAALLGWAALLHWLVPRRDDAPSGDTAAPEGSDDRAPASRFRMAAVAGAALLLLVAGIGVYRIRHRLGDGTVDPAAVASMERSLRALPAHLGDGLYRGEVKEWGDDVIANSGADAYGAMVYRTPDHRTFEVFLGGSLRATENFHTPNVCLPSAGWETLEHAGVPFEAFDAGPDAPRMQRLLLQRGQQQMLVYTWFQAGDRLAGSEWDVRLYRLVDLLKDKPLEPTLIVSVYVPVEQGIEKTEAAALRFLAAIGPYVRVATAAGVIHG